VIPGKKNLYDNNMNEMHSEMHSQEEVLPDLGSNAYSWFHPPSCLRQQQRREKEDKADQTKIKLKTYFSTHVTVLNLVRAVVIRSFCPMRTCLVMLCENRLGIYM
jgi:hypothetical protein